MSNYGIHHLTAIAGNPNETLYFYNEVLGLRLVKQTVNFDDPKAYHLYFGNADAKPGTLLTFFNREDQRQGVLGDGQISMIWLAIPKGSFTYWENRLKSHGIAVTYQVSYQEEGLVFQDNHGLSIRLVERSVNQANTWSVDDLKPSTAIHSIAGATLLSSDYKRTIQLLTSAFGYQIGAQEGVHTLLQLKQNPEQGVEIKSSKKGRGVYGIGSVHHIAFRTSSIEQQNQMRTILSSFTPKLTSIKDRTYFESTYFREPGGHLIELATDGPGFFVDENESQLGLDLQLPLFLNSNRNQIEQTLPQLHQPKGGHYA